MLAGGVAPTVVGGRFLRAYRKLAERAVAGGSADAGARTPHDDDCHVLPAWEKHSFAYVVFDGDDASDAEASTALEVAAALSQFEPVTVCVSSRSQYVRVRRSLPDHVRVLQLFDVPKSWTEHRPVSFVHGPSGDVRLVEWGCAERPDTATSTFMQQVAQVERLHRYAGPALELELGEGEGEGEGESTRRLGPLDVDGQGKLLVGVGDRGADGALMFAKGLRSFVRCDDARFAPGGALVVPRGTAKDAVEALRRMAATVHLLDDKYLGFYAANGGVLVPQCGGASAAADDKALLVMRQLFPRRRVVQVQTSRKCLNVNEYALGFCGSRPAPLPGKQLAQVRALTNLRTKAELARLQASLAAQRREFELKLRDQERAFARKGDDFRRRETQLQSEVQEAAAAALRMRGELGDDKKNGHDEDDDGDDDGDNDDDSENESEAEDAFEAPVEDLPALDLDEQPNFTLAAPPQGSKKSLLSKLPSWRSARTEAPKRP